MENCENCECPYRMFMSCLGYDMYVDRSGRCDAMRQDEMVPGAEGKVVVMNSARGNEGRKGA